MTVPTLADLQYQFLDTGVLLNDHTDFVLPYIDVVGIDGLDGPEVRAVVQDRDGSHGGFVFSNYMKGRALALDLVIYDRPDNLELTLDALKANFAPTVLMKPFYYKWPGVDQRVVYGKAQGLRYKTDPTRTLGIQTASVQILGEDARAFSSEVTSTAKSWGTHSVALTNHGNIDVYPIIQITGSVTNPVFTNTTTGQVIELSGEVANPGDCIINTTDATITQGDEDVTGLFWVDGSQWIYLAPGVNNITWSASSGGSSVTFIFQSAYL